MRFSFLIVFFFLNLCAIGQNLVPNPSFEDPDFCPFQINQIQAAIGWMNWRGSPELFNSCASGSLNVPNAGTGYQTAHTGFSMGGMVGYLNPSGSAGANYREFIATQLNSPLIVGQKYFVSFYASLADAQGLFIAIDKIGLRFSTSSYTSSIPYPLLDSSHVKFDSIVNDTLNWMKCFGSFIADSNYNFICLGNFYHDSLTVTSAISATSCCGYYYIDDVCVSLDSNYTNTWTELSEINSLDNLVSFNPNPADFNFKINSKVKINSISLFNSVGNLIYNVENPNYFFIDTQSIPNGLYLIILESTLGCTKEKIIIHHN